MSRSHSDVVRFRGEDDYGRHVTELRRRARRADEKDRSGRHNRKMSAIRQSEKDS